MCVCMTVCLLEVGVCIDIRELDGWEYKEVEI